MGDEQSVPHGSTAKANSLSKTLSVQQPNDTPKTDGAVYTENPTRPSVETQQKAQVAGQPDQLKKPDMAFTQSREDSEVRKRQPPSSHPEYASPPNLRRSFVPDRGDHWSPEFETRPDALPISKFGRPRIDRYVPNRRSSPPRHPSPPRRQLSERHDDPRVQQRSISPPALSRPEGARHDSASRPAPLYRNKTWTAAEYTRKPLSKPAPLASVRPPGVSHSTPSELTTARSADEDEHEKNNFNRLRAVPTGPKFCTTSGDEHAKIDYNGLKAVPTGPKRSRSLILADVVRRGPHILIPATCLPVHFATIKHLHGLVKAYVPNVANIHLNPAGYILSFEDTDAGRERLELCYGFHHLAVMFGQYVLLMERRPNGEPEAEQGIHAKINEQVKTVPSEADKQDLAERAAALMAHTSDAAPAVMPSDAPNVALKNDELDKMDLDQPRDSSPTHEIGIAHRVRQTLPPHVSSRPDREDSSSSISGVTGSEISASKKSTCHACKAVASSDVDPLICCSSCPRLYHRRCQVPRDPDHKSYWQCRRCIKKELPPRSRPSSASLSAYASNVNSNYESGEPLPKRRRLEIYQQIPAFSSAAAQSPTWEPSVDGTARNEPVHAKERTPPIEIPVVHHDMTVGNQTSGVPISNSDDMLFGEADVLVERSFAQLDDLNIEQSKSATKPRKLSFERKKIARTSQSNPPEEVATESNVNLVSAPLSTDARQETSMMQSSELETPADGKIDAAADRTGVSHTTPAPDLESLATAASHGVELTSTNVTNSGVQQVTEAPGDFWKSPTIDTKVDDSFNIQCGHTVVNSESVVPATRSDLVKPSDQPAIKMRRVRPSMDTSDRCSNCDKKILRPPSGRALCSRCKAELKNGVVAASDGASRRNGTIPAQDKPHVSEPETEKTLQEHKATKSDHPSNPTGAKVGNLPTGAHTDDQTSQDDLDFWTVKSPAEPAKEALNNSNTLPADPLATVLEAAPVTKPSSPEMESENMDSIQSSNGATSTQNRTRKSHTRPAEHADDLGDSFQRPKNTYRILIGMALGAAPGYRLKAQKLVEWIADNIPGYAHGQGNWESGIRATLTLSGEHKAKAGSAIWRMAEDPTKPRNASWWELLPGLADTLPQWDPVLKKPVSPLQGLTIAETNNRDFGQEVDDEQLNHEAEKHRRDARRRKGMVPSKYGRLKQRKNRAQHNGLHQVDPDQMDVDAPEEAVVGEAEQIAAEEPQPSQQESPDSSDDEPLLRRRGKTSERTSRATTSITALSSAPPTEDEADAMELDDARPEEQAPMLTAPGQPLNEPSQIKPTPNTGVQLPISTKFNNMHLSEHDFSAKSLFEEWPEYHPDKQIGRDAKIAEIKMRPSRKQRFMTLGPDPWVADKNTHPTLTQHSERMKRSAPIRTGSMEDGKGRKIECHTVAELFNLPNNLMPIMHEGQLCFRDGTLTEDGTLPRAKVIYKTGYA